MTEEKDEREVDKDESGSDEGSSMKDDHFEEAIDELVKDRKDIESGSKKELSTEKDEDWGYYSKNNSDCAFCQDKCINDTNCGGVECGGKINYCSWWKQGRCVTKSEKTYESDLHETCIKFGEHFLFI